MSVLIDTKKISKILINKKEVSKIYLGTKLVYQNIQPLIYEITGDSECTVSAPRPNYTASKVIIPSTAEINGKTYTVTSIKSMAFFGCKTVTEVQLPNTITSIETYAFESTSLKTINFPTSLKAIKDEAFCNTLLENVSLPESITVLNESVFSGCKKLKTVKLPQSITTLKKGLFRGCSSLTSVQYNPNIISVEQYAFRDCTSLKNLFFTGTSDFHNDCALGAYSLVMYTTKYSQWYSGKTPLVNQYTGHYGTSPEGLRWATTANNKCIITKIPDTPSFENVNIPATISGYKVTNLIGYCALSRGDTNIWLKSISFPENLESLYGYALYGCSKLTNVKISSSLTEISRHSFDSCTSLRKIFLPKTIQSIGDQPFWGCSEYLNIRTNALEADKDYAWGYPQITFVSKTSGDFVRCTMTWNVNS